MDSTDTLDGQLEALLVSHAAFEEACIGGELVDAASVQIMQSEGVAAVITDPCVMRDMVEDRIAELTGSAPSDD